MTKLRKPQSFEAALDKIRGDLTRPGMAEAAGKSESTVQQWTDPDVEAWPDLPRAVALDLAWMEDNDGSPPIYAAYTAALGGDAHRPVGRFGSLEDEGLDAIGALSLYIAHAREAKSDGQITPLERHEIEAMRAELYRQLGELDAVIDCECGAMARAAE